jgi:hypothetical protein
MKAALALGIMIIIFASCGGRGAQPASVGAGGDILNRVAGTWARVGKECDAKGDNCVNPTADEQAMRWMLSKDGTGSVTDSRAGRNLNIPISYTLSGNVLTEKDNAGNIFVNTVISVTDRDMIIDQPYLGRRIINKYRKAE